MQLARKNREELRILRKEEEEKQKKKQKQNQQIKALSFNPDEDEEEEYEDSDKEDSEPPKKEIKLEKDEAKEETKIKVEQNADVSLSAFHSLWFCANIHFSVFKEPSTSASALKDVKVKEEEKEEPVQEKEEEKMSPVLKKKRFGKNPDVDTSFLPDVERDEEENKLREQLRQVRNIF